MGKQDNSTEAYHQLFTKQFREWMDKADINTDKFTAGLTKKIHQKLYSGKGFGRDGMWNWLWKRYTGGKDPSKMNAEGVKKFEREVSRFFGIDDKPIVPCR